LVPRTLNKNHFLSALRRCFFFGAKTLKQNTFPRRALSRGCMRAGTRCICRLGWYCTPACERKARGKKGKTSESTRLQDAKVTRVARGNFALRRRALRYVSEGALQCAAEGGLLLLIVLAFECHFEIALSGYSLGVCLSSFMCVCVVQQCHSTFV